MTVHVRFFASLRERLRRSEADWEVAEGATVEDLWQSLCAQFPELTPLGPSVSFAVNQEYVNRDFRLSSKDEVALIPPVSGGLSRRRRS